MKSDFGIAIKERAQNFIKKCGVNSDSSCRIFLQQPGQRVEVLYGKRIRRGRKRNGGHGRHGRI